MGVDTAKHIRKPLYVDAVRVTARNFDAVVEWCDGEPLVDENTNLGTTKKYIKVEVHDPKHDRQTKAFIGDWILYTQRGYKVYTNKAFRAAFDEVIDGGGKMVVEQTMGKADSEQFPKFYLKPNSDMLTETQPYKGAQPLSITELTDIVRNELIDTELQNSLEDVRAAHQAEESKQKEESPPPQPNQVGSKMPPETEWDDRRKSVEQSGDPQEASVEETVSGQAETPDPESEEETAVSEADSQSKSDKRILSEEEQEHMGSDEVRELVSSGEAVLAQDLTETS